MLVEIRPYYPTKTPKAMLASTLRKTLAVAALSAAAVSIHAANSVPSGIISYTIAAGPNKVTTLSVPLRDSVPAVGYTGASSGFIASVAAGGTNENVITVTGAGWDVLQFRAAAQPYFIRVMSGSAAGRTLAIKTSSTANTAETVIVDTQGVSLVGVVAANDKFEVFPGDTIKTFFADLIAAGSITTGATAAVSDTVQLHNGTAWVTYFHNGTFWRPTTVNVNNDNTVIRPDAGIIFTRRSGAAITFNALGVVPSTNLKIVLKDGGVSFLGNLFPVTRNLSTFGYTSLTGWTSNATATLADRLQINNGTNWQTFFHNGTAWRLVTPAIANDPSIPVGRPAVLVRPTSAATLQVQNFAIPYTL